jgi:hypothetical protein
MGHFVVEQDFSIPLGIETDLEKSGDEDSKKYFVKLMAGDNVKDIQQEIVEPEGFILDYLMKGGYFNYDHGKGAENLIGEPTDYELVKNTTTGYCGLLIKGFFYKSKSAARNLIEHLKVLKEIGSKRRIGASVEGKTLERKGNRIVKAWVKNIAITEHPINRNTWVDLVKSFAGVCQDDCGKICTGECMNKAMTTGSDIAPTSGASTLRKQSLNKNLKVLTFTNSEIAKGSTEFLKLLDGSTFMDDQTGEFCKHQTNNPFKNTKKLKEHLKTCRGLSEKVANEIVKMLVVDQKKKRIMSLYTVLM